MKTKSSRIRFPRILAAALFLAAASAQFVLHAQSAAPPPAPPPATPGAADENAEVVVLPEFAVRTSRDDEYLMPGETLGAMRVSTPLIESPVTVSVITAEFIESFMLDTENDQISMIPGGNFIAEWQTGYGGVTLRGFSAGGDNAFRNGFKRWGGNSPVNVERIEYIKGPLAASFGRSQPGGIMNYITKRAQRRPAYGLAARIGPHGYSLLQANATGPLASTGPLAGKLFYRVDLEYFRTEGVQDFFYQRRYTAAASVTWQIGRSTSWMLDFEHRRQIQNPGQVGTVPTWAAGTLYIEGRVDENGNPQPFVPWAVQGGRLARLATFNARGPDASVMRKTSTIDTRFEHRFNQHLSFRVNGQHWFGNYEQWDWGTAPPAYSVAGNTIGPRSRPLHRLNELRSFAGQADLLATFKIGPTSHKLLLTADGYDYRFWQPRWQMSSTDFNALPLSMRVLDVSNPDWTPFDRSLVTNKNYDTYRVLTTVGSLLSERMELLRGRVLLYASLRYDNYAASFENRFNSAQNGSTRRNVFNETFGGVAHLVPGKLVAFANRSSSFAASYTLDEGVNELQDPYTSHGIEAGFRGKIFKDDDARRGFYWTASVYRIDERGPALNPLYSDQNIEDEFYEPGTPQFINNNVIRIDGAELELSGNISQNASFRLAFTKLHAFVKSYVTDPSREGVPVLDVPDTRISSSYNYRVNEGPLKGLSFGASMRYNGEYFSRYGTAGSQVTGIDAIVKDTRIRNKYGEPYGPNNRIEEIRPAVVLFDAFVQYQFRTKRYRTTANFRHTIGLNMRNLNNTVWYNSTGRLSAGREIFLRYGLRF